MNHLKSRVISAAITATVAVAGLGAVLVASAPTASAASGFRYRLGYTVQHGWLCNGWRSGMLRCTAHWKVVNGHYVSLNPAWVPSQPRAGVHHNHPASPPTPHYKPRYVPYPFGECTYGAYLLAHDNVGGLGMARDWYANAIRRGLPTGSVPRVGATVVFAPGVQGASRTEGHVGHVIKLGANGMFLMEAMNDNAGFGRFGFRWVHAGWGVHFIY